MKVSEERFRIVIYVSYIFVGDVDEKNNLPLFCKIFKDIF